MHNLNPQLELTRDEPKQFRIRELPTRTKHKEWKRSFTCQTVTTKETVYVFTQSAGHVDDLGISMNLLNLATSAFSAAT
jgi:hypothetical protein